MRLYCNTEDPFPELQKVTHYLIKCWFPIYFLSKVEQNKFRGPSLLLKETQLCKQYLSLAELSAVIKKLTFNGQWAHPENIILALLNSSDDYERRRGVQIIREIRRSDGNRQATSIRLFHKKDHTINPAADSLNGKWREHD